MNNAVVYYSDTNRSKKIAEYIADQLRYPAYDISVARHSYFESLVLVFPVHCQTLPPEVCAFLSRITAKSIALIATYGRMCKGNALNEAQQKYGLNVIAAAYVPTSHAYLNDADFCGFEALEPLIEKILNPAPVKIPKSYKNPIAGILPKRRSQLGIKLYKTDMCNKCGACTAACAHSAIDNGVPDGNCIRCLRCVSVCPRGALKYKLTTFMKLYMKKKKRDELILYI